MIKVENLTKRYAGQTAIQDLNFEVSRGEIMGFLGPNGTPNYTVMRLPEPGAALQLFAGAAALVGIAVWRRRQVR